MDKANLNFLYEIGSLKNVERGWRQHLAMECATVPEHTMRVVWLALFLAKSEAPNNLRGESGVDENKVLKMALVHDLAEARVSDLSYVQKVYVKADEEKAASDLFLGTIFADYEEILKEYEARQSLEAKIVKDADNLDVDLELKEFEERGSRLPAKWQELRRLVRDQKLYTETARKLWDEIQTSSPADWHISANKWIKMPNAGK